MAGRIIANMMPVLCGILGAVIANMPVSVMMNALPAPLLALMPIYFWCLLRPDLMTAGWVFVIGLTQDLLSGSPPGVWTLSFVLTYALTDRLRDAFAGLTGFGAIFGFALAALTASFSAFVIVAVYFWRLPSIADALGLFALTVLLYIPIAALLSFIHRRLVGAPRSDF